VPRTADMYNNIKVYPTPGGGGHNHVFEIALITRYLIVVH